jgi:hypothetical protein
MWKYLKVASVRIDLSNVSLYSPFSGESKTAPNNFQVKLTLRDAVPNDTIGGTRNLALISNVTEREAEIVCDMIDDFVCDDCAVIFDVDAALYQLRTGNAYRAVEALESRPIYRKKAIA